MKYRFSNDQMDEYIKKVHQLEDSEDEDFVSLLTKDGFLIMTGEDMKDAVRLALEI